MLAQEHNVVPSHPWVCMITNISICELTFVQEAEAGEWGSLLTYYHTTPAARYHGITSRRLAQLNTLES